MGCDRSCLMTRAQGVHSSSHRPSGLQMWPEGYHNGRRGHKNTHTHTEANITQHTHTHSDEWMPHRFDVNSPLQRCRKFCWDCVCVSACVCVYVCVCVCIIKPSSNIYWGQMGGRMLPVSARGNEGSWGMMKRWGCSAATRVHFTYNGNPESLPVFLSLSEAHWWRASIKDEMQTVFRAVLGGVGEISVALCWAEVKLGP